MTSKEPESTLDIRGWDAGDDDFDISVRMNGVRFKITVSAENFTDSPSALQEFHQIFEKISAGEDDAPEVWDYSEQVANVFRTQMRQLSPPVVHSGKLTLADLGSRGNFECEFRVVNETPIAGTVAPLIFEDAPDDEWNVRSLGLAFPIFTSMEVEVPYDNTQPIHNIVPQRVHVHGKVFFYKSCWSPYDAIDELKKYSKLTAADKAGQLLTSRLSGVVANANGQARGLLYDWIEVQGAGVLTEMLTPDTPSSLREKWAAQVQNTVAELHRLEIVWGDVKPDNVLIDKNNNAIVIDLEGGTTRGWVDQDIGGSIEGDLQGLERLVNFILRDEVPDGWDHMSNGSTSNESS